MKFIEYEEQFGEYTYPEGFENTLDGLSAEQQTECFRTTRRANLAHTGWSERSIESSGIELEDCSAVTAAVVKDGKIVGVMMKNDSGREVFCPPEKCICTYYAEDNNGAGYKTREEYTYLICVSKDSE